MEGGSFRYSLSSFGVNAMNRIPAVTAKTMSKSVPRGSDAKQSNGKNKRKRHEETRRAISYQRMSHPNIYAKGMNTTDDATDTTSRTTVEPTTETKPTHTTRIPHAQQRKPAMSYVLYFSKPFALAIAIWPFLSLLLTLPVLALLYHRDNRLRFTSALTAYLVVLYLIALACFTMYPMPENPATYCAAHHLRPQLNPFEFIHDIRTDGITGVMQLAMNVVFFLPLGYFMKRVFLLEIRHGVAGHVPHLAAHRKPPS